MGDLVRDWVLVDTLVAKVVSVAAGAVIINLIARLLRRWVGQQIQDADTRYQVRRAITSLGYLATVAIVLSVFSNQLAALTVALGVASAGVAFALQEVISSSAGWVAISLGRFYESGDRVQLGGIVGDVVDIGVLRTTLLECGEWVRGDQYSGRTVGLPIASCSRNRSSTIRPNSSSFGMRS